MVNSPMLQSLFYPMPSLRGNVTGPLLYFRTFFVDKLNAALKFCDLDSAPYKAHSFRIGAASWAAAKGFSDSQICLLGRLKSNAFLTYIRTPSLGTQV